MSNQLINLVMDEPPLLKNYAQVKFRKKFSTFWYMYTEQIEQNKNQILLSLLNYPPTIQYTKKNYYIPIYLPIKEEFLDNKNSHSNDMYIPVDSKYESKDKVRKNMFINFLKFLDKKNINYFSYDETQNILLGKLIVRLMKWDEKSFTSLVTPLGILYNPLNNLSEEDSYNIFDMIKNNWSEIWTSHLPNLQEHFINAKFCDPHIIFEVLEIIVSKLDPIKLPLNFLDDQVNKIIVDITEFSSYYNKAKNIVNNLQYLSLYVKTYDFKDNSIKKIHKI